MSMLKCLLVKDSSLLRKQIGDVWDFYGRTCMSGGNSMCFT